MLYRRICSRNISDSLPSNLYFTALASLLVLSEVFSSNIQEMLPAFSHIFRLLLTGAGIFLLLVKLVFFTKYECRWQLPAVAFAILYSALVTVYAKDTWFFLAVLCGLAAKGLDLRRVLRVYLIVAVAGLVLVQLLHYLTPLVPYHFYCRNWDYAYGHYNGYGARLFGIFIAYAWLRFSALRWYDWCVLAALPLYTLFVPGCRGAGMAMVLLVCLLLLHLIIPKAFEDKVFHAVMLLFYPLTGVLSMLAGWFFDPSHPEAIPWLTKISVILSGRLEIWHHVFWGFPYTHPAEDGVAAWYHGNMPNVRTLLGGFMTDSDAQHAIDNSFLALIVNKGILGTILISALLLLLVWRLCKHRCTTELICLLALFAYLLMENKPFMISANPFFLLLPVLLAPRGAPLPILQSALQVSDKDNPE